MSISDIFDPIVMGYFDGCSDGGSSSGVKVVKIVFDENIEQNIMGWYKLYDAVFNPSDFNNCLSLHEPSSHNTYGPDGSLIETTAWNFSGIDCECVEVEPGVYVVIKKGDESFGEEYIYVPADITLEGYPLKAGLYADETYQGRTLYLIFNIFND